jgi:ribosomal protein S27AE
MAGDDASGIICCLIMLLVVALLYPPTQGYAIAIIIVIGLVIVGIYALGKDKKSKPISSSSSQPRGYRYPSSPSYTYAIKCPSCGFENTRDQSYCGRCGATLRTFQRPATTPTGSYGTRSCPHCGYTNPRDNRYCGRCGILLDKDDDSTQIY